jgi:hypothetical protein
LTALAAAEAELAKLRAENENVRFTAALTAERNADEITELRVALAAAEAKRDALRNRIQQALAEIESILDPSGPRRAAHYVAATKRAAGIVRRALSVEATGTEGMITNFERDDGLPAGPDAGIAVEATSTEGGGRHE